MFEGSRTDVFSLWFCVEMFVFECCVQSAEQGLCFVYDARAQSSSWSSERRFLCPSICLFDPFSETMADMERAEAPVATPVVADNETGVGAPEGGVPVAKAAGPHPPPATAEETNLVGNTAFGVLLPDDDLMTVPLDNLLRLQMGSVECSENLVREMSFEIAKSESERWHTASNRVLENLYRVQGDLNFLQRLHQADQSQDLGEMILPESRGENGGKTHRELQIVRKLGPPSGPTRTLRSSRIPSRM